MTARTVPGRVDSIRMSGDCRLLLCSCQKSEANQLDLPLRQNKDLLQQLKQNWDQTSALNLLQKTLVKTFGAAIAPKLLQLRHHSLNN